MAFKQKQKRQKNITMYKLEFILKQHTPIIHFQHDHDAATLRATEVKPKLDRFILGKLGDKILKATNPNASTEDKHNEGFKIAKAKGWLIGKGEHPALDYKLRITNIGNKNSTSLNLRTNPYENDPKKKFISDTYPLLLANMGGKPSLSELKDLIMYDNLLCKIVTSNKAVIDEIEKILCLFFATNNFGNRNNKGFGSFSICQINNEIVQLKSTLDELDSLATLKIETDTIKFDSCFIAVDFIWKLIKSGINFSRCINGKLNSVGYEKSVLFNHMEEKYKSKNPKYTWEKRWIKEKFMAIAPIPNQKATFARGLLGLNDKFEYKAPIKDCNSAYSKQKPFYDFSINISNNDIDRIASPFTFKIIENSIYSIYILIDNNFDNLEIFNKPFEFQLSEIKDFKLITGYDIIKNRPKFTFIKPNSEFAKINDSILVSAETLSEKESKKARPKKGIVNQIQRLKDYCEMTQYFASINPNLTIQFTLNTPNEGSIDLKEILAQFQKQYPNFIARDFGGGVKINCKSNLLKQE
jgi:hypothetical protein